MRRVFGYMMAAMVLAAGCVNGSPTDLDSCHGVETVDTVYVTFDSIPATSPDTLAADTEIQPCPHATIQLTVRR